MIPAPLALTSEERSALTEGKLAPEFKEALEEIACECDDYEAVEWYFELLSAALLDRSRQPQTEQPSAEKGAESVRRDSLDALSAAMDHPALEWNDEMGSINDALIRFAAQRLTEWKADRFAEQPPGPSAHAYDPEIGCEPWCPVCRDEPEPAPSAAVALPEEVLEEIRARRVQAGGNMHRVDVKATAP